jgi:hypothetical protein
MDIEFVLGLGIILGWCGIVIMGAASLVMEALREKDWNRVAICVLTATTVAGPLLVIMPDHEFLGGHTMGLGFVLAILSGFAILCSMPFVQRMLRNPS